MREQNEADDNSPDDVAENNLKKREVRIVGKAGNADDRERAGLCRDDGERDGPPWDVPSGQKIIAQSALLFPKTQAEQRDARKIEQIPPLHVGMTNF